MFWESEIFCKLSCRESVFKKKKRQQQVDPNNTFQCNAVILAPAMNYCCCTVKYFASEQWSDFQEGPFPLFHPQNSHLASSNVSKKKYSSEAH